MKLFHQGPIQTKPNGVFISRDNVTRQYVNGKEAVELLITTADLGDLPAILALQYLAYQSEAKLLGQYDIPPLKQTLDEVEVEYRKGIILKATDSGNHIVGSVRAYAENGTAFISKLIVHPQMQGNGIGTQLLTEIERACLQPRYELFTSNKSVRNLKLYERLGYVPFESRQITPDLVFIYLEKMRGGR